MIFLVNEIMQNFGLNVSKQSLESAIHTKMKREGDFGRKHNKYLIDWMNNRLDLCKFTTSNTYTDYVSPVYTYIDMLLAIIINNDYISIESATKFFVRIQMESP